MDPAVQALVLAGAAAFALAPVVIGLMAWHPVAARVEPRRRRDPPRLVACEPEPVVIEPTPEPEEPLGEPDLDDFAARLWALGITEVASIGELAAMYDEYRRDVGAKRLNERQLSMRVSKCSGLKRYRDSKARNATKYRVTPAAAVRLVQAA